MVVPGADSQSRRLGILVSCLVFFLRGQGRQKFIMRILNDKKKSRPRGSGIKCARETILEEVLALDHVRSTPYAKEGPWQQRRTSTNRTVEEEQMPQRPAIRETLGG